jgi:hypothetical protein
MVPEQLSSGFLDPFLLHRDNLVLCGPRTVKFGVCRSFFAAQRQFQPTYKPSAHLIKTTPNDDVAKPPTFVLNHHAHPIQAASPNSHAYDHATGHTQVEGVKARQVATQASPRCIQGRKRLDAARTQWQHKCRSAARNNTPMHGRLVHTPQSPPPPHLHPIAPRQCHEWPND